MRNWDLYFICEIISIFSKGKLDVSFFFFFFVLFKQLWISERCQSTNSMSFSVRVFKLKVSTRHWILKPSVSCSAAVHHCHPFHLLFSPFSALSLSSLASVFEWCSSAWRETSRERLQPLLLCAHSIHSAHPSPDGWLRTRHISSSSAAPCRTLLLLSGMSLMLHLFVGKRAFFSLCDEVKYHMKKKKSWGRGLYQTL